MDSVVPDDDTDQTDVEEGETPLQQTHLQIQTLQIPMNDNSTHEQNIHPVESKTSTCDHQSCDNCAVESKTSTCDHQSCDNCAMKFMI